MEFANLVYMNMDKLEITYIPNLIYRFIDNLCNVYIKLSRDRMKSENYMESLSTLHWVLKQMNLLLAPFTPHLAEYFNKQV
jgi:valyl-tRNA synthetase